MVVRRKCVRGMMAVLLGAALALPAGAQEGAQEGEHPALMPRYAISVPGATRDAGLRLVLDTALDALTGDERALWFLLEPAGSPVATDGSPAAVSTPATDGSGADPELVEEIADQAWREHQAEVLVLLSVQPAGLGAPAADGADAAASPPAAGPDAPGTGTVPTATRGTTVEIRARFFRVRPPGGSGPDGLDFWEGSVELDAAGRYQRSDIWDELVATAYAHAELARPAVELTVRSDEPVELRGLPDWAPRREGSEPGEQIVTLRSLRQYDFVVARPGHRDEEVSVYVERTPLTLTVNPVAYPRHTVGGTLRGLAWPGLEYGWYNSATTWTVRGGVTSFLLGLTPLRQSVDSETEPQIFSSYGLTEVEVGGHRLLGNRDRRNRFTVGAGAVLRLVHGNVSFGLDPAIPWALRPTVGSEWELGPRMILVQHLGTDLFLSPRPAFVPGGFWMRRVGPLFWQLPIYRVGLRVRL